MKNRKFIFVDNTVLWIAEDQIHLTNDNLTDEAALNLLRRNKGYVKYFKTIPENWLKLLNTEDTVSQSVDIPTEESSEAKSAIELALEQMNLAALKKYAAERKTQYPKWGLYQKKKATLLKYILKNV